jgi:hypothetical protein
MRVGIKAQILTQNAINGQYENLIIFCPKKYKYYDTKKIINTKQNCVNLSSFLSHCPLSNITHVREAQAPLAADSPCLPLPKLVRMRSWLARSDHY